MILRLFQDSPSRYFERRKQIRRSVSCSWHHEPPVECRSIRTTDHIHRHRSSSTGRDAEVEGRSRYLRQHVRGTDRIAPRNSPPRRRGEWRAPRRRFVSNEARTLKSRRPARHAAVPHVLFLSSSLSRSLLTPCSLRLFFFLLLGFPSARLAESRGSLSHPSDAHSSPILRIALYFLCLALHSSLLLLRLPLRRLRGRPAASGGKTRDKDKSRVCEYARAFPLRRKRNRDLMTSRSMEISK